MSGFHAGTSADALQEARRAGGRMAPLPAAPATEAEAYATQREIAGRMGAIPPAGFKIGATTARMQAYLGLAGPAAGFMPAASLLRDGARLRYADFTAPGVECEVAVRLATDLPPGPCTQDAARVAVAEVFAAIEIVDNRYADLKAFGTPALIADQVFHAAAVPGAARADWRDADLGAVRGQLSVDGVERDSGHGRDLLGHPLAALAWLAGSGAAAAFGGLRAGQVVLLGSVTPPVWLDGPAQVTVAFDGFAPVSVVFA